MIPAALQLPIFGQSNSTTVQPYSYYGQQGWFALPLGWGVTTDSEGIMWTSNPENGNRYSCRTNVDGTIVFLDLYRFLQSQP